ncbi:RNA polymerase sigma factor, partial [Cesiribacter andamanensis]
MGGSLQDAKDIFQDALLCYFEKETEADLQLRSAPAAYLLGIAKHLWNRRQRKASRLVPLSELEPLLAPPPEQEPDVNSRRLLAYLEGSGRKCLDLLR